MRSIPLKLFFLTLIFSFSQLYLYGQHMHYSKPWKATLFLEEGKGNGKIKGILYTVSDTSLTIRLDGQLREILYNDIDKIRLVKNYGKEGRRLIGLVIGATTGAVVGSNALARGGEGEGRAYGGILSGIGGGLIGGGIGFAAGPAVYNLLFHKKVTVRHDSVSYQLLKFRLNKYSIKAE